MGTLARPGRRGTGKSAHPPGHHDCADSTRMVVSVAGWLGLGRPVEPGSSVAIERAAAFNPAAFLAGKLRAAGGLIKPTPVDFPENRLNKELESSPSGLRFDRSHTKGSSQ